MSDTSVFTIGADGLDAAKMVEEIQSSVQKKMEAGVYADARIARAERSNLAQLKSNDQFLSYYLQCLRDSVYVDISDFEIRERRPFLAPLLIGLKKTLWNLLKFYTYRLWSQQNQVNGLMVTAIEGLDEKFAARIKELQDKVAQLEKNRP